MRKGKRTEVVSPQLEPYAEDIAARIPRKRNKVTPEVAARVVELRREGLSREGPSEIERRPSRVESMPSDLFSALESAYRGRVNPKIGCLHIGRYEGAKCIFENPSKLQCALCPYYVSKVHMLAAKEVVEALEKILSSTGTPALQPPAPTGGAGEKPKDAIEELVASLKDLEAKRAKLKEVLEKLGFKVEDVYMRREEVERLIEEVRCKAVEEALDDKRIEAVERIIDNAISRLIELFRPAVQAFLASASAAPEASAPVAALSERRRPKVEQLSRISRLSGRLGLKVLRGAVSWLMLMD